MAEFDFAPRPPKQTDQVEDRSPFGSADPTAASKPDKAGPAPGPMGGASLGKPAGSKTAASRNPGEAAGMLSGLISMATTMGMARFTNPHVDQVNSPTGLMGLVKSAFSAKHEAADDHKFNLDLSRHGVPGGGQGVAVAHQGPGEVGRLAGDRHHADQGRRRRLRRRPLGRGFPAQHRAHASLPSATGLADMARNARSLPDFAV